MRSRSPKKARCLYLSNKTMRHLARVRRHYRLENISQAAAFAASLAEQHTYAPDTKSPQAAR